MCLSAFAILQTPVRASSQARIGLPLAAIPDYMKYITVNNFKFDPLAQMPSIPAGLRYDSIPTNSPGYYLVQFNGPVTNAMKQQLTASGVTILYYIAYNTFIVRADGPAIDRAAALPSVRWTGIFEPAYKLSPRLSDEFGAIAQRAMDRARYGDQTSADAVTVIGSGMASKTLVDTGLATTANGASQKVSPVATSLGGRSSSPSGADAASSTITVAHIHTGASGVAGGVLVPLIPPAGSVTLTNGAGSFTQTSPAIDGPTATSIINNPAGFYFNIHTALNPGGVMRGQLVRTN